MSGRVYPYPIPEYDYPKGRYNCYCSKCFHFNLVGIMTKIGRGGKPDFKNKCSECNFKGMLISKKEVRTLKINKLING